MEARQRPVMYPRSRLLYQRHLPTFKEDNYPVT
jgi:hypothetical protein